MTRMLVLLCAAAAALGTAAVASGAQPVITDSTVPLHSLGIDPISDLCGFDVELWNEGQIRTIAYSDGTVASHHHERYYWKANGRTLTESDDFTITDRGDSLTFRGTVFNVHVPGVGVALVEAGLAVFENGALVRMEGLHQVLDGSANAQAVCDYLSA